MNTRLGAIVAPLLAAAVLVAATAGVAALTADVPARLEPSAAAKPMLEMQPLIEPPALERDQVAGIASNYPGTAGWIGEATVALPSDFDGRYTGHVNGYVTVCADRCVRLPIVDWCQCYRGTDDARVVDLSHAAWPLVTDAPLSRGLVEVRLILEG